MTGRFATVCDAPIGAGLTCTNKSEEYGAWPTCRECSEDVCSAHTVAGSLIENDGVESVICLECVRVRLAMMEADPKAYLAMLAMEMIQNALMCDVGDAAQEVLEIDDEYLVRVKERIEHFIATEGRE